ncbi:RNA polymerase [Diaporthe sp. PMI_573]|nr:RNA polymerase [Diaporthaceae sp. PMI_573]
MDEDGSSNREANLKEAVRFWRAWKTVHQMCKDRGYELTDEEVNPSLEKFKDEYTNHDGSVNRSRLQFSARPSEEMIRKSTPPATASNRNPEAECGEIYVEFMAENNMGIKDIKKFVQTVSAGNFRAGIMVTIGALSPSARRAVGATSAYTQVECFLLEDLLVNITHHDLVPTHVVLSKEEKAALLKRYRLKETQLPRILLKDPIARYFGLRRGQVVKIIRSSETAGRYASYRLCV